MNFDSRENRGWKLWGAEDSGQFETHWGSKLSQEVFQTPIVQLPRVWIPREF
jgi:hypothetical protein